MPLAHVVTLAALLVSAAPAPTAPPAPKDDWSQWYWVYEGIAHGQSIQPTGTVLTGASVRVARLGDKLPDAPLWIEIRDATLEKVLAKAVVSPKASAKSFKWVPAGFATPPATLEKGGSYVLVLRSPGSAAPAPWILNANRDATRDRKAISGSRRFAVALQFKDGPELRFGPPSDAPAFTPSASGTGVPFPDSLLVELNKPLPK